MPNLKKKRILGFYPPDDFYFVENLEVFTYLPRLSNGILFPFSLKKGREGHTWGGSYLRDSCFVKRGFLQGREGYTCVFLVLWRGFFQFFPGHFRSWSNMCSPDDICRVPHFLNVFGGLSKHSTRIRIHSSLPKIVLQNRTYLLSCMVWEFSARWPLIIHPRHATHPRNIPFYTVKI